MAGIVQHNKYVSQADFTGTVTAFDSAANTLTIAVTDQVRPSDFNSNHNFFVTISGNTAGVQSTASGTNLAFAGGPFLTASISQNTAGGATLSFNALPDVTYTSRYTDFGFEGVSVSGLALTQGSASFRALNLLQQISFTRIDIPIYASPGTTSGTGSGSRTNAAAFSSVFVIYTRDTNFSLNPIVGQSSRTTYTWASNSANFSSLTGGKYLSFAIATSLVPGEYFCGWQVSTATSSVGASTFNRTLSISVSCIGVGPVSNAASSFYASSFTDFGVTASASTNSYFAGVHTNTITATNQTIAMSNITVTGTANYAANQPIMFRNY